MEPLIPFYKPYHDTDIEQAVIDALRSGWIGSGPKVRQFETALKAYTGASGVVCTGSAGMSLQMILRWFGIKPEDEVILPAFTHPATANAVMQVGAKPVFADVNEVDMTLSPASVDRLISKNTKAVIAVDLAGMPCNYPLLYDVIHRNKGLFQPCNDIQHSLGRILLIADASHSFGASIENRKTGTLADITVVSFHAVKNFTTGEGAAIFFQLSEVFSDTDLQVYFETARSHGMTADAFFKLQHKTWNYDVPFPSGKSVMTDLQAAMGLVLLEKYESIIIPRRKELFEYYNSILSLESGFIIPPAQMEQRNSCCHLYIVRIPVNTAAQRDMAMKILYDRGIITNLHFIPVPMLSYYQACGYSLQGLGTTQKVFTQCLSLPLFHDLTLRQIQLVCDSLTEIIPIING